MTRLQKLLAAIAMAGTVSAGVYLDNEGETVKEGAHDVELKSAGLTDDEIKALSVDVELKGRRRGLPTYHHDIAIAVTAGKADTARLRLARILCGKGNAKCIADERRGFGVAYSANGKDPATHYAARLRATNAMARAIRATFPAASVIRGDRFDEALKTRALKRVVVLP